MRKMGTKAEMRKMGTKAADLPGKCNLYVSDYTYDATVSREPPGHYLEKTAARVPFWQPFHRDGLLAHWAWSPRCYGPVPGAGVFKCPGRWRHRSGSRQCRSFMAHPQGHRS